MGEKRRHSIAPAKPARLENPSMKWWVALVPALVAVIVFLNTLGNELTYDDKTTLGLSAEIVKGGSAEFGRALTYVTHLLDAAIWRGWLPGRRITNLVLYALATSLASLAAARLCRSPRVGLTCGLLFAVHPVHVEAVASISFRKDILAMIFAASTLLVWMTVRSAVVRNVTAAVCFLLGLLSKEVAVIGLLPFLFLVDWLGLGGDSRASDFRAGRGARARFGAARRAALRLMPLLVLGAIAIPFFNRTLHTPEGGGSLWTRFGSEAIVKITEGKLTTYAQVLATSARSFLDVIRLLVFPLRLSVDYDTPIQRGLFAPGALTGLLAVVACLTAAFVAYRRVKSSVFAALAWTLLLYAPASNLVPLTHFFVADRYLLVPSFGVCLLGALGFAKWMESVRGRSPWVPLVTFALLAGAGAARTMWRNRDWRNEEVLWSAALRAGSNSYRVHYNMGNALLGRGEDEAAKQHFETALRQYPAAPWARAKLVEILYKQEKYAEAESNLRTFLGYEPNDVPSRYSLARVLARQRRFEEALAECELVLAREPAHVSAQYIRAGCLEQMGSIDAALVGYRQVLQMIAAPQHSGAPPELDASRVQARIHALEQRSH